jgi:hypothetical protein
MAFWSDQQLAMINFELSTLATWVSAENDKNINKGKPRLHKYDKSPSPGLFSLKVNLISYSKTIN